MTTVPMYAAPAVSPRVVSPATSTTATQLISRVLSQDVTSSKGATLSQRPSHGRNFALLLCFPNLLPLLPRPSPFLVPVAPPAVFAFPFVLPVAAFALPFAFCPFLLPRPLPLLPLPFVFPFPFPTPATAVAVALGSSVAVINATRKRNCQLRNDPMHTLHAVQTPNSGKDENKERKQRTRDRTRALIPTRRARSLIRRNSSREILLVLQDLCFDAGERLRRVDGWVQNQISIQYVRHLA